MKVEVIESNWICDYCANNDFCSHRYDYQYRCENIEFEGKKVIEVKNAT